MTRGQDNTVGRDRRGVKQQSSEREEGISSRQKQRVEIENVI